MGKFKKGIQGNMTKELHELNKIKIETNLNNTDVALGPENMSRIEQIHNKANKIHYISNKSSYVSAFLQANPADNRLQMNNFNFCTSIQSRLLLPLNPKTNLDRKFCPCGEQLDRHLLHSYSCTHNRQGLNKIRNPMHSNLKQTIINVSKQNPNLQVFDYEPSLSTFFQNVNQQNTIINNNTNNNNDNNILINNPNEQTTQHRADIAIRKIDTGEIMVVDFKLTEANKQSTPPHTDPCFVSDHAQKIKENTYKHNGHITTIENVRMFFAT